ncbi:hypothetical protein [Geodermatophilus sp. DSM 45219]|uniref:hypothetical protein n=1 Tax=Geodermatophilus sp. DSM 45219 TaxID=1881103 RepID=UPI000B865673|nr:hypothetical protein [Geodermatophilus sp. DSM 45219]
MLIGVTVSLLATLWVIGATALGFWAGDGWIPALLLGGFCAYVMYGHVVPAAWHLSDSGSVRQGKRALRQAQQDGNPLAILLARGRLALSRWQRRW